MKAFPLNSRSKIIYKFINEVFPLVKKELNDWQDRAQAIPDPVLSQQALASIDKKGFHSQGGCIFTLYNGSIHISLLCFIVALQTISDYLDNLCDRAGVEDHRAFLQLHKAILHSLNPHEEIEDYYAFYPHKDDGGYLQFLVLSCRSYIKNLPGYSLIQEELTLFGKLYGQMQSLKHVHLSHREQMLINWARPYLSIYPHISVWEFSAAAGSTLAIFFLCTLAENKSLTKTEVTESMTVYFPWVCGLHILLDYFIDEKEDSIEGDLNFVSCYRNEAEKKERLQYFLSQSMEGVFSLPNAAFHQIVIEGLLAMYLSDPKASLGSEKIIGDSLFKKSSRASQILFFICKLLRKNKRILSG